MQYRISTISVVLKATTVSSAANVGLINKTPVKIQRFKLKTPQFTFKKCPPLAEIQQRRCFPAPRSYQQWRFVTLIPDLVVRSIAIGVYVCMYVFFSARSHISKTTCPGFTTFSVPVTCGRGSVLLWRHYDKSLYFRFCGWRHVSR